MYSAILVNNYIRLGHVTHTTVAVSKETAGPWTRSGYLGGQGQGGALLRSELRQERAGGRGGGRVVAAVVGPGEREEAGRGGRRLSGAVLLFGRPYHHAATSSSGVTVGVP